MLSQSILRDIHILAGPGTVCDHSYNPILVAPVRPALCWSKWYGRQSLLPSLVLPLPSSGMADVSLASVAKMTCEAPPCHLQKQSHFPQEPSVKASPCIGACFPGPRAVCVAPGASSCTQISNLPAKMDILGLCTRMAVEWLRLYPHAFKLTWHAWPQDCAVGFAEYPRSAILQPDQIADQGRTAMSCSLKLCSAGNRHMSACSFEEQWVPAIPCQELHFSSRLVMEFLATCQASSMTAPSLHADCACSISTLF